jgi:hypothetical protein
LPPPPNGDPVWYAGRRDALAFSFLCRRCVDERAARSKVGGELGRFGARAVSRRQCFGAAEPSLCLPRPAGGAHDQTFRLIVRPDLWGRRARLHFSNVFGVKPVTFDGVFAGLHLDGGAVVAGTNRAVHFGGKPTVTIPVGASVWSDPVDLPFVRNPAAVELAGRKLAVSFHVAGDSGPMTWHAKALTTSYLTRPGAGAQGQLEDESAFPFSTTSWYFLDAVDVMAPAATRVIVAFGDSITDGTASTLNGDDRWPNALSRRLHAAYGNRVSVVNAGIGGNQVLGPAEYSAARPFSGGPSAGQRLERDVIRSLRRVGSDLAGGDQRFRRQRRGGGRTDRDEGSR